MLIKNYGTLNANNLAFRTTFIDEKAFNFYQTLKNGYKPKLKGEKK